MPFLNDFFIVQSWHYPQGAIQWMVPNQGHECFAEIGHAAGGVSRLIEANRSNQWSEAVQKAFCAYCGVSRLHYDPLAPYKAMIPECWTTKWLKEFTDWYLAKNLSPLVDPEPEPFPLDPPEKTAKKTAKKKTESAEPASDTH